MSQQLADRETRQDQRRLRRFLPIGLAIGVTLFAWFGFSFAGMPWLTVAPAALVLLVAGPVWLIWTIVSLAGRTRPRLRGWIAAGTILAVAVAGIALNLPVKARFAVSVPSFDRFVEQVGPPPTRVKNSDPIDLECPRQLGLYAIDHCEVTAGGYLFFDPLGNAMLDYAGFAYLPDGPRLESNAGFELQELVHLQGNWYAFAASW